MKIGSVMNVGRVRDGLNWVNMRLQFALQLRMLKLEIVIKLEEGLWKEWNSDKVTHLNCSVEFMNGNNFSKQFSLGSILCYTILNNVVMYIIFYLPRLGAEPFE